ncbi:hypothetical protein Goari_005528, partial [Gossypium aridum]|nr:hypothetical protein [Gossypium aridum]
MENGFLIKWKTIQQYEYGPRKHKKSDSLIEGYMSELWDFTHISYWNPAYSCFTFGKVGLLVTIEEYTTLFRCPRIQADKAYSKAANDLILAHLDTRKKVDIFVLSIYGVMPIPTILAVTFRYLSAFRRAGEERFIECAQLLLAWFHSHIWKSLQNEDIEWRSPWMIPDEILYRCKDFDW